VAQQRAVGSRVVAAADKKRERDGGMQRNRREKRKG
jgi:hypothetical protein